MTGYKNKKLIYITEIEMAGPSLVQFFDLACTKYMVSVVVTTLLVITVSGFYLQKRKKKKVLPAGYHKVDTTEK